MEVLRRRNWSGAWRGGGREPGNHATEAAGAGPLRGVVAGGSGSRLGTKLAPRGWWLRAARSRDRRHSRANRATVEPRRPAGCTAQRCGAKCSVDGRW
uniref:Uncharacterized protein n=1 Tax=Aegilops tauschii subsp. strangulata TaxID=200361 RepID=A0A453A4N0_AEGTS